MNKKDKKIDNIINTNELLITDKHKRVEEILRLAYTSSCDKEKLKQVKELIEYNPYVFWVDGKPLKATNILKHKIPTTTDKPVVAKKIQYPPNLKIDMKKELKNYLKQSIIVPSVSPHNSNTWIVSKKLGPDGEKRYK